MIPTRKDAGPAGDGPTAGERRAAQGAATRRALLAAGLELFGTQGFADTSLDEIVAKAEVTKGALYHHFGGKESLFAAVYELVQQQVSDRVVEEFLRPDAWEALIVGCDLWIDAHMDPAVQRIIMRDARAVLSWEMVRSVETRFGAVPIRGVLRRAVRTGVIEAQPLRPLALLIMGALNEACFYVADADNAEEALDEVHHLVHRMLAGLAVRPTE
jgi:AcrR family transcriptional regulator